MARRAQQINGGSARSRCFPSCGRYSTTIVRSTCQVQLPNFLTPCPARHLCNGTGDAYLCSYSLSYSLQMQLQLAPQGVPLKFGVQLLLSGKQAILSCHEEDLQEVLSELPSRIQRPEDVDILLHSDLADKTEAVRRQPHLMIDPVLGGNMPPVQVFEIKPTVRMPRRWQPWKFISVAMVIPWLLMHATQQPTLSKQVAPPMLRKASLPPVLHFVPMHEANWPK